MSLFTVYSSPGEPFHLMKKMGLPFKRELFSKWLSLFEPTCAYCSLLTGSPIFLEIRWEPNRTFFLLRNSSRLKDSAKMELHRELSYGQPNGSPRRASKVNIGGSCQKSIMSDLLFINRCELAKSICPKTLRARKSFREGCLFGLSPKLPSTTIHWPMTSRQQLC